MSKNRPTECIGGPADGRIYHIPESMEAMPVVHERVEGEPPKYSLYQRDGKVLRYVRRLSEEPLK